MSSKIILSDTASDKLAYITAYMAEHDQNMAENYVERLLTRFRGTIGEFPLSSPTYNRGNSIRRYIYKDYNVYYMFDDKKNEVHITNIAHGGEMLNFLIRS